MQDAGVDVVRYEARGWGVGELWLDDGVVVASALPRGATESGLVTTCHTLALRLQAWFAGAPDPLDDVPLDLDDETAFGRELAHALAWIPRGEVVTYGELAALAGHPGAARAAGTFCARCELVPFLPVHRVAAADGIGGFGSLGVGYKRRLLRLEGVRL